MALDRRSYELAMQGRDLPWLLAQWVKRSPDKDFLIWAPHQGEHRHWSYAQFDAEVRKVAGGLTQLGLVKGDRLLIHLDNCPEMLVIYFACAAIGAVTVLGNTRSAKPEVAHYVNLVQPVGIVTQKQKLVDFSDLINADMFTILCGDDAEADLLEENDGGQVIVYDRLVQSLPLESSRPIDPFLDIRVQFTSGTTSRPKAVLTTHANTLFAAQQTAYAYALGNDDICQIFTPLYHNNGLATLTMTTLWIGGTIVLQPKFSASNFWGPALQYGSTWTAMPGSFFLNAMAQYDVPEHKFRFWMAAVLPEIGKRYGIAARGHWGMTEMITLPLVGDPFHEGVRLNIGRPAAGNEIAIRRTDGTDCEPGEMGRLYVRGIRGITMFKEYLNDPEATAACFDDDGWFDTGDCIRIDENGDILFASRMKDMLRVGGENVAAIEIEAVIMETGWVAECAVIGKPHDMLDEVPVAFVLPSKDAPIDFQSALIEHCASQLADFKVIREVHVVEEFPRSTLNKIAKSRLREMLGSSVT